MIIVVVCIDRLWSLFFLIFLLLFFISSLDLNFCLYIAYLFFKSGRIYFHGVMLLADWLDDLLGVQMPDELPS